MPRIVLFSIFFALGLGLLTSAAMAALPASAQDEPPKYHVRTPPSLPPPTKNAYEIIAANKDLSSFAAMIDDAGVKNLFLTTSEEPVTVFAPTNKALEELSGDAMKKVKSNLASFVQYHVISNSIVSSGSIHGRKASPVAANGEALQFDGTSKTQPPTINGGLQLGGDIRATNGIVHIVSTALVPPSLAIAPVKTENVKIAPPPPPAPIKQPTLSAVPTTPVRPVVPTSPIAATATASTKLEATTTGSAAINATTTNAVAETPSGATDMSATTTTSSSMEATTTVMGMPQTTTAVEPAPAQPKPEEKKHGFELLGHKFGW